jgi:uncharacterized protein with FMN-binding domain
MNRSILTLIQIILTIISLLSGCATAVKMAEPVDKARLNDGVYQGRFQGGPNTALVEVTIENQEITELVILEHDNLLGKKAEEPVVMAILKTQSTDVDAVTGATNSSHVIMNAVQDAVEKAYRE